MSKNQNPIIVDELPKQKHTCFLGSRSLKSTNKIIQIYIFHREEIFLIKINNGLTVNELIEQILQKIKIIKEELELFLIYDIFDIKTYINKYQNYNSYFKNLSFKNLMEENKIKKTNNELKLFDDLNNNRFCMQKENETKNNNKYEKQMLLFFPDIDNKFTNLKIKDLFKNKINYYIKANQVSKNKYNSQFNYRKEIKNLNMNSFISNINKEIEKNNLILSSNNNKTVDIEKGYKELGKDKKYRNVVYIEGIELISDFLKEIEKFLNEKELKDNYNCCNIGQGKYFFGFPRKDIAYDFLKFLNLLQLANKKYFGIRCKLKIFNVKKNLKSNSREKAKQLKKNFYYNNKFNNNNYYALKNNLNGPFYPYFLNKGQKKYIVNDDTESMNEIVMKNKFKFKNVKDMNYVDLDNFSSIPLI